MNYLHLALLSFAGAAFAAPVAQANEPTPTRVFSYSGDLRGSTDLIGYDPDLPMSTEDTTIPWDEIEFAPGQDTDTIGQSFDFSDIDEPQPIRGTWGSTDPGPKQPEIDRTHPDILAPPQSDTGDVAQLNWPMDLSHVKKGRNNAGWSRQQNIAVMPVADQFAGVDMRLEPGAYRELHWHTSAEWAYVINGSARVGAVNEEGETFYDDVTKGDVWFFPAGVPHYIQGLENGTEFLLVFDDGNFSEDETFLVTEMFARTPVEVWSKELDLPPQTFSDFPEGELFIFNGTEPPQNLEEQNIVGPAGSIPQNFTYSYHWSLQEPMTVDGGSVKILDPKTFPIAADFSTALVTIKPGAIREVHWHPSSDEWSYFISGHARMGVYVAPAAARTFNFNPGDVGYVPKSCSHYVENIGTDDVVFIEVLKQDHFTDVSAGQWLGLTPPLVLKDTLGMSDEAIAHLSKEKPFVVQGRRNDEEEEAEEPAEGAAAGATGAAAGSAAAQPSAIEVPTGSPDPAALSPSALPEAAATAAPAPGTGAATPGSVTIPELEAISGFLEGQQP